MESSVQAVRLFPERTANRGGLLEDESMNEERACEIAIRIRDEFEDSLDEKNIIIPSADRKGVPGEARL